MKTKIFILFILVMFACLPLKVLAVEHNFSAGSLIFPMDNFYQDPADGGALETYGIIFYLLDYKRQDCVADCSSEEDCVDSCGIPVYWVIKPDKTEIGGIDLEITATSDALAGYVVDAVVKLNDQTGGTTGATTNLLTFNTGDSANTVTYRGGLFIIDITDLERAADVADQDDPTKDDLAAAYQLINSNRWSAVDVHVAQVPFAAPVFRKMQGIPPKIALMNDDEDRNGGNAAILESYLRLAGICDTSYDVLTPYDIAGIAPDGSRFPSKLFSQKYDFLWAPHWTAKDYDDDDRDNNDTLDVDDIMEQIQRFVQSGKAILAECASIEVFEHNTYGRFLTDKDIGHNGGSNDEDWVIYHDKSQPYSQIGDDPVGFEPEGGHLHNWRPLASAGSVYRATVTRFTVDDTNQNDTYDDTDWDYYVGGYAYGDSNFGYVVYLGGHKYAKCDAASDLNPHPNKHLIYFEFNKDIVAETFTLVVEYAQAGITPNPQLTVDFDATDIGTLTAGSDLEIDFTGAVKNGNEILGVAFTNKTTTDLFITNISLSWNPADAAANQKFKKLIDTSTDAKHFDGNSNTVVQMPITKDFSISAAPSVFNAGCTANDDCEYSNLAGVRYVLNTLFNIKYEVKSKDYVRAPPIVSHPYLYQGTFEYPSNYGHFRRYDVTQQVAQGDLPAADWDTGAHRDYGRIEDAKTGNSDGRRVYTARIDDNGDWQPINFDAANVDALITAGLDVEDNNDTADEIKVIERLRGREWNYETEVFDELNYKLGGIMHSAPVIIKGGTDSRFASRAEMAYVGDIYGMLHAIDTTDGKEKWAYIPSNLLGKLKNVRGDPSATQDFAAVDASPAARDVYYNHDGNDDSEWRTILVSAQGFGGKSIFALDVSDPAYNQWKVLWETTVLPDDTTPPTPGGGMGNAYRASLDKVKWPVIEANDENGNNIPNEIIRYEPKWMVFVATSYAEFAQSPGGIHVFAFDLKTGDRVWGFSSPYADAVNDIPGAATTYDIDDDTLADRLYVGDMNGRMWELALTDDPGGEYVAGQSVHFYDGPNPDKPDENLKKPIPLFNAGVGNPISVSPSIIIKNGHVLLIFGTGGADWAPNDQSYHVLAVDATEAGRLTKDEQNKYYQDYAMAIKDDSGTEKRFVPWELELTVGEKVWSSPTISAGQIWVVTSSGSMESADPSGDTDGTSKLRLLNLDNGSLEGEKVFGKKIRGSIYISRKHVYMTALDGEIIQLGDEDFSGGNGNRVVLKSWQDR